MSHWLGHLEFLHQLLQAWGIVGLLYVIAIQLWTTVLTVLGFRELRSRRPATRATKLRQQATAPVVPGVSVLVPAHNEGAGIVTSVRGLLASDYAPLQIVVVSDGSTDDTISRLAAAFALHPTQLPPEAFDDPTVTTVWAPLARTDILLIERTSSGGKAAAIMTGVAFATHPYVAVVDADSIPTTTAISRVMAEVRASGSTVVAAGGTVLPANGCQVFGGHIPDPRVSRNYLVACQTLEYLRAFVLVRPGLSTLGATSLISGAFGIFHKETLLSVGGFRSQHLGEDMDFTLRIQERALATGAKVIQVPEAVCWTEAPQSVNVLARQRRRWHRGLTRCLLEHRYMFANPRYRTLGLIGIPTLVTLEFFAPLVELSGYLALALALVLRVVDWPMAFALLGGVTLSGYALSVFALLAEVVHIRRYLHGSDIVWLLFVAALEQLGYRQLTVVWRASALWKGTKPHVWGVMPRQGFADPSEPTKVPQEVTAAA